MTDTLRLSRPDDWHVHLRDEEALKLTVPHVAKRFARAIVMPNLVPPVDTLAAAAAYRQRIVAHAEGFEPLMTLYVTESLDPEEVVTGHAAGEIAACKLYPASVTTNSDAGIQDLNRCYPLFEQMQQHQVPLLVHAETSDPAVDVFDREAVFLERHLAAILADFPELRVVVEHITTAQGVEFVRAHGERVAATITAHHLMFDRNDLINTRVQPHLFCLPVLKRHQHQQALVQAATSGDPQFFFGSDSAPHVCSSKESAHGCAGVYTAPVGLAMLATVFEQAGALDQLEAFVAHHGADFYRMPRNTETITLQKAEWQVPDSYEFAGETVVPACAGETLGWRVATS